MTTKNDSPYTCVVCGKPENGISSFWAARAIVPVCDECGPKLDAAIDAAWDKLRAQHGLSPRG